MAQLKDSMIQFLSSDDVQKLVKNLARKIERDYQGKEVTLICPLKGSVVFMADLSRELNLDQKIDFVHLTSPKREGVRILKDITLDITNKHVLIIEEIVDAGRTLSFLRSRIVASGPASVKIVALFDKPARRELPIKPDYTGQTLDDRYVIGYGMDSEELGRNYKALYNFAN